MNDFALKASALLLLIPVAGFASPDASFDSRPSQPFLIGRPAIKTPAPGLNAPAQKRDARYWIVVRVADDAKERSKVADCGIALEAIAGDKLGGVGTAKSLKDLAKRGFGPDAVTAVPLDRLKAQEFPPEDAAFHDAERTETAIKAMAASRTDLASVFPIGRSLNGKDILALRINPTEVGTSTSAKPGIVFLGTHHAREHLSTEVPLLLAQYLLDNSAKPEIAQLLKTRDIYIIPMVNRDGVEIDIEGGSYHMQRKNARQNPDGTVGVDLNRNYGFHWGEGGASPDPGEETYRGPAAFSEPETQAVRAFVEARPNLKILLSYHTFSELILYPWGHSYKPIPDGTALKAYQAMAQTMAGMTGYKPQQSSGLYIASGDTTDWAWGVHKIFSFTFELTPKSMWDGGFYPGAGAIQRTFQNNIRPALYLIGLADNPLRAAQNESTTTSPQSSQILTGGL